IIQKPRHGRGFFLSVPNLRLRRISRPLRAGTSGAQMHFTGEPCMQLPATHLQAITSLTDRLATSQMRSGRVAGPIAR
ncbi:hypothetical protein XP95_20445, partial [Xanthomonas perforans]